jgi:hypothetical protein
VRPQERFDLLAQRAVSLALALDESRPGGEIVLFARSQENGLGAFRVCRHEIVLLPLTMVLF